MPSDLIQALRSGSLKAVRDALDADAKGRIPAQAVTDAGRLAFQAALALFKKRGADLNGIYRGYRALHSLMQERAHRESEAPSQGRVSCLEWLLANGADPELPAAWPPARGVIIAAFTGVSVYVEAMRSGGARFDGFAAAALGDVEAVRSALASDPSFATRRDAGGLTALQCSAGSRMNGARLLETAKRLLDAGADFAAKTESWSHKVDALYMAANAHNKPVFDLMLELGANADEALTCGLWNATEEFAEAAMAHGANPDRAVADGRPLLNDLIRWGQFRQALWLLGRGASPNIADEKGWTAMHQAASRGNAKMMRALIDAGGDLSRRDAQGNLPRDVATKEIL